VTKESPVKTATQVLQEVDERNRAASPMLVRVQAELFQVLLRRVYGLLLRAGKFPAPPTSLMEESRRLKVDYISPLTASQRQMEGLSVMRLFEMLAPWGQVDPGIFDNVDSDEVGKALHVASNAPVSIWRSDTKRQEVRDQRLKNAQLAQNAELFKQGGDTAAKLIAANGRANGS
jgi:hypothetical protein